MSDSIYPSIIATDGYLNDPIQFRPDVRFSPESALSEIPSQSVLTRDASGYLQVNLNAKAPQRYIVPMISTVLTRIDFTKLIDTTFKQLGGK